MVLRRRLLGLLPRRFRRLPFRPMQSAAIPFRATPAGHIEVLLVTSRRNRRWIIPKGKVARGMLPHRSAAKEALEEAGVVGVIENVPVAEYVQTKLALDGKLEAIRVRAFPLAVTSELQRWREDHQRERRWLPLNEAIRCVDDPAIRTVLKRFAKRAARTTTEP